MSENKLGTFDRTLAKVAPRWALSRMRARIAVDLLSRHYEAASGGRRTSGWTRSGSDANAAAGPALSILRAHARELVRNNCWARNGLRTVATNTVGWGIRPKANATGKNAERIAAMWRSWAETTECDAAGRHTFYGIERLVMEAVAEGGEVLVRRRRRLEKDGLTIPLQLQVLEADFIDTSRDGIIGEAGGPVIQGVEFDKLGRRVAYWLFPVHPGSSSLGAGGRLYGNGTSQRVPAEDIVHVFDVHRAGQVRGVTWFAPAIVPLKDFDDYEDAVLVSKKIAACFSVFVTDLDGAAAMVPGAGPAAPGAPAAKKPTEFVEPGMITHTTVGSDVKFATPPAVADQGFTERTLRRVAAGLGVTYEDLTGDYSQVNFSSARMARLKHYAHVHDWRWNMLIPTLCDPVWAWAMEAAELGGLIELPAGAEVPSAQWTPPPMPMLEPDKEGLAYQRLIRNGGMTLSEVIRERGYDPDTFLDELAKDFKKLDELGLVLDCDPRKTSQAGQAQKALAPAKSGAAGDGKSAAA